MAKKEGKKRSVREQMKQRTEENYKNKDYGVGGARVLDLSSLDDVEFFKPEKGKHCIDIIPYEITTNNHMTRKPGELDYVLEYYTHYDVGARKGRVVCPAKTYGKPCPICEEMEELKEQEADEDLIDALKPKRRVLYNVIDTKKPDKGIMLFDTSHYLFEAEILDEAGSGDESIVFSDTEDGASISFRDTGKKGIGRFKGFAFEDREEPYDDDIIDEAYSLDSLLVVLSYEEIHNMFHNADEDDEEEEKPQKSRKDNKGKSKKKEKEEEPEEDESDEDEDSDEDDSGEDEDPDEDDEEEEKPQRTKKGGKPAKEEKKKSSKDKPEKGKSSSKNKCPHGHKFGTDCDETDDCAECENWEACAEA